MIDVKKDTGKFWKSRKFWASFLIVASVLLEICCAIFLKDADVSFLENLCYATQIVSSIFVVGGVVIAVWQYYLTSQSAKTTLQVTQVQRAIDLSEYYKDNILKYTPAIYYIFDTTGITEILDVIMTKDIKDFDVHELNKMFTPMQIERLKTIQNSDIFFKAIMEANDIYHLDFKFHMQTIEQEECGAKIQRVVINKNAIVVAYISNLVNRVLNNLEYFALHFRHQTADESVVYQSLHQSFLGLIPYLYYYIAKQNNDSTSKLYTNVIWLYLKWKNKKENQDADRSEKSFSVQLHGTIIQKID